VEGGFRGMENPKLYYPFSTKSFPRLKKIDSYLNFWKFYWKSVLLKLTYISKCS
jgi:hypothetical protein